MTRLIQYSLNITILLLAAAVGATLLSSPNHTTADGIPALHWNQVGDQTKTDNLSVFVWPSTEVSQSIQAISVTQYTDSAGIFVMTSAADSMLPKTILKHLDKAHADQARNARWSAQLQSVISQEPSVKFAWISSRESQRPHLDSAALEDALKSTQAELTMAQQRLKSYELETAVLTDQLEKQWSERLVRQSVEDTGTITVMRARAHQDLRLRLAKSQLSDSEIRLEGLSKIETARLDYLSTLNVILRDTSGGEILNLLEQNSVYQSPILSTPDAAAPSVP
jgi:hypothetical protein